MTDVQRSTIERVALWERLAIMVAAAIIAAAITGVSREISQLNKELHKFREAQVVIKSQIGDVRSVLSGFYAASQAKVKHEQIYLTDQDQYSKINDHEQRLRALEQLFYGTWSGRHRKGGGQVGKKSKDERE